MPLYYAFLAVYFGAAALRGRPDPLSAQAWYWLHLSNWQSAYNPLQFPSLSVFWSLAIEEQFYLVWPLLVWTLSPRALFRACLGGALACMALRNFSAAQAMETAYPLSLCRLTPFHIDGLLLGSLCALIYRDPDLRAAAKPYLGWLALLSAAAFLAIAWSARDHSQWMSRFGYAAIALAAASLVLFAALHSPWMLRAPVLRSFGKYSYCIYVIHTAVYAHILWPLQKVLGGGEAAGAAAGAVCIAAIYLAAACSWKLFEKRFLALAPK
jgi:peptidoglycan/LPS O-acetylase OafA/YrhL